MSTDLEQYRSKREQRITPEEMERLRSMSIVTKRDVSDEPRDEAGKWTDGGGGSKRVTPQSLGFKAGDYPSGHLPAPIKAMIAGKYGGTARARSQFEDLKSRLFPRRDKALRTQFAAELQARVPMIRMPSTAFTKTVKDGEIRNQFETGKSSALFSPSSRREEELRSLGYPLDTPASERPVYGYMAKVNDSGFEGYNPSNPDDVKAALQRANILVNESERGAPDYNEKDNSAREAFFDKKDEARIRDIMKNPDDYVIVYQSASLGKRFWGPGSASDSASIFLKSDFSLASVPYGKQAQQWLDGVKVYEVGDGKGNINAQNICATAETEINAHQYGDVQVELKPHMLDRTTVTDGDSLGTWMVGVPYQAAVEGTVPVSFAGAELSKDGTYHPSSWSYIEAQFGGANPTLADIQRVTFTGKEPSSAIANALYKAGVDYQIVPSAKFDESTRVSNSKFRNMYSRSKK